MTVSRILVVLSCLFIGMTGFSQSAKSLKKGLVAYYPFNNDTRDASGQNNHGSIIGGVVPTVDRFGNDCSAMDFNGINGYIRVPSSVSLESPDRGITITGWFKLHPGGLYKGIKWATMVCKSDWNDENPHSPHYRLQVTEVTLSINTDFTEPLQHQIEYDKWYFYAMSYDGVRVQSFLNDAQVMDFYYSNSLYTDSHSHPLDIGRDIPGEPEYHYGVLDDIRIYNRALDRAEIMALYQDDSEKVKKVNPCNSSPASMAPQKVEPSPEPETPATRPPTRQTTPQPAPPVNSRPTPPPTNPNPSTTNPGNTNPPIIATPTPNIPTGPTTQPPVNQAPPQNTPTINTPPEEVTDPPINASPGTTNPNINSPQNNTPPPPATQAPPPSRRYEGTLPPPIVDPANPIIVRGDTVDFQKVVHVSGSDLEILLYDHQKEDGDIVSINVNGVWVVNKHRLKKKNNGIQSFNMTVQPETENYLISKAWNLGRIPPNTLTIEIRDGSGNPQVIPIESDIGRSGAIKFVYDPD